MFGFILRSLGSLASFGFPVLASYKALEHDDITLLRPWLIYWVVVAVQLTIEGYIGILLRIIPFYEFWRLLFTLWLVLPQFQGASYLYFNQVQPFLRGHEEQIDELVASGYQTIKSMGVDYLSRLSKLLKKVITTLIFGPEAGAEARAEEVENNTTGDEVDDITSIITQATTSTLDPDAQNSYVDMIFSKFRIPDSAYNYTPSVPTVNSILTMATNAGKAFKFTIPDSLKTKSDKLVYLDNQRAQLVDLMATLDEQRKKIEEISTTTSLKQSTSNDDFDLVAKDEIKPDDNKSEVSSSPPSSPKRWFGWK